MLVELVKELRRGGPRSEEFADSADKRIWHSEAMRNGRIESGYMAVGRLTCAASPDGTQRRHDALKQPLYRSFDLQEIRNNPNIAEDSINC